MRGLKQWLKRGGAAWTAALVLVLLAACGGGGADRTKANLRFVNATSGYAALDLLVDDQRRFSVVVFGDSAAYVEADPKRMASSITHPGSATSLHSLTPAVSKDKHYTLLAYGGDGALASVLIDDNAAQADSGKARLRVLNAASDAGSVDVYLTGASEALAGAVALRAGAQLGSLSDFSVVSSGDWRIRITGAGDKTDLRLDLSGVTLARAQVATLVITPTTGGVLVNALLLTQQGSITRHAVAHARVRAAAPNAGTVSAAVRGVALMEAVGAPAVGAYQFLPAGQQPVTLLVDGTPVTLPNVTLAAGTDQTLLIYTEAGAPAGLWLADDNRTPASPAQAKVRLVHGRNGLAGAVSLKLNFLPATGEVALPGATPYASVAAGGAVRVTVSEAGNPAPVFDAADQTLAAGGIYSVFVIDGVAPAAGFVRRDR